MTYREMAHKMIMELFRKAADISRKRRCQNMLQPYRVENHQLFSCISSGRMGKWRMRLYEGYFWLQLSKYKYMWKPDTMALGFRTLLDRSRKITPLLTPSSSVLRTMFPMITNHDGRTALSCKGSSLVSKLYHSGKNVCCILFLKLCAERPSLKTKKFRNICMIMSTPRN